MRSRMSNVALAIAVLGLLVSGIAMPASAVTRPRAASGQDAATLGTFSAPFEEPTILGKPTKKKCIEVKDPNGGHLECKPAAGSMTILANGKIVYWNALEGTENVKNGIAAEFGKVSVNDQARLLDLGGGHPRWSIPTPKDAGAKDTPDPLVPGTGSTEKYNDGALFCSDLNFLADGRVLVTGGTLYFNDPGPDAAPYGVVELQGLRNTRIYDPKTNTWTQTGSMHYGRWYPTMVTLGDGKTFIASGVRKLLKPIYPDSPADSGTNVKQTETYDPATGKWTYNGSAADQSLPLFPRLSLLPDGHVFYNAAGQDFNPSGQSYDEPAWNFASSYDPAKKTWTNLGAPGVGTLTPGFRGSTFSIMQPLTPDQKGNYSSASFLSAGGVLGTTPGSYLAVPTSAITTVDTSGGTETMTTKATGDLAEPRWYSTAVLLPTGQTIAFNGANRDEVVGPGTGFPVQNAEMFDPTTGNWTPVANSHNPRTYHNTAALLPDGRVLVGGHAPISTLYGSNRTLPGGFSPNDGRDPSFEIYSPPYMFWGPRPQIREAPKKLSYGKQMAITIKGDASSIDSVVLVRNTSLTHLVDGDQRSVVLPVIARAGHTIVVKTPPNGNVAPPGPYLLFVNQKTDKGLVPSVGRQTFLEP
ncbi:MAG: hypothetical protein QOC87_1946 [Actinomycetota bacterium]|nr:hypothetical protein [Actinomycetota bacterium]